MDTQTVAQQSQPPLHLLNNGGKVVVVGVRGDNLDEHWRSDARVDCWDADSAAKRTLPSNCKAVALTRFVSHSAFENVMKQARKRHITVFPGLNGTGEIKAKLANMGIGEIDPETQKPVAAPVAAKAKRGALKTFIETHAQLDGNTNAEAEARRLFPIAQVAGIPTTLASLAQGIRSAKRALGIGERPASITPKKSDLELVLQTFDDAVAGLQLVRDYVAKTRAENADLKARLDKLAAFLRPEGEA